MTEFLHENDHRETLDQIIHTVNDSAPEIKQRKIAVLRRHTEAMLQVLLESRHTELYKEYYDKFKTLGFDFESLREDTTSN